MYLSGIVDVVDNNLTLIVRLSVNFFRKLPIRSAITIASSSSIIIDLEESDIPGVALSD